MPDKLFWKTQVKLGHQIPIKCHNLNEPFFIRLQPNLFIASNLLCKTLTDYCNNVSEN